MFSGCLSQIGLCITSVECHPCARKCFVYVLERVDHDKVKETYVEMMGLNALEWIEAYDYGYKTPSLDEK